MSGDDEVGQHIISINKPGPQDFFPLKIKKRTGSNIHTRNHPRYNPPSEPFIPVSKITPQLQLLGVMLKKGEGGGGG